MKIFAIIPARAGSKRLRGKNLKLLGDKPLIAWSIEAALQSGCLQRVIVSTEDPETADIARQFGAETPFLRSHELASDTAKVEDVVIEVLKKLEQNKTELPDAALLLQPTSPFRTVNTIQRAVELFKSSNGESVVSVSPASSHPNLCRYINEQGEMVKVLPDQPDIKRSQDLPPVYALNGMIYLVSVDHLKREKSFYTPGTKALIVEDPAESLDIDTSFDWFLAESILEKRGG